MRHLTRGRLGLGIALLLGALLASAAFGLAIGPTPLSASALLGALSQGADAGPESDILWRIRMPRVLLAALVGACLATSGVIFQALLRNPLADPFILGVSGGAALSGIAVLSLGSSIGLGYAALPPAAFAGGIGSALLLFAIAGGTRRAHPTHLLLIGVVFNAFASAAIVFLASLAGLTEGSRIFLWLIGNLSVARVDVAGWLAAFLILGLGSAMLLARSLNLLSLGDDSARELGVPVERHRILLLASTALMVSAAVSVSGLIGFVGLIIPHLLRLLFGPDHRLLVPAAALGGAAFLVACDTIARSALGGRELPVGAVTAVLGGPFFLLLLRRSQSKGRTA